LADAQDEVRRAAALSVPGMAIALALTTVALAAGGPPETIAAAPWSGAEVAGSTLTHDPRLATESDLPVPPLVDTMTPDPSAPR
jgi:hypothetical protein